MTTSWLRNLKCNKKARETAKKKLVMDEMRDSLSVRPKAGQHEYVVKAPVTPAVSLLCVQGMNRQNKSDQKSDGITSIVKG